MKNQEPPKVQNKFWQFFLKREKVTWYYLVFALFFAFFLGFTIYFLVIAILDKEQQFPLTLFIIFCTFLFLFLLFVFFYAWKIKRFFFTNNQDYLQNFIRIVEAQRGTLLVFNDFNQIFWTNNPDFFTHFLKEKVEKLPPLQTIFSPEVVAKIKSESFFLTLPVKILNETKRREEIFFLSKIGPDLLFLHYNSEFLLEQFLKAETTILCLLELKPDYHKISQKTLFQKYETQILAYWKFWLTDFFQKKGFLNFALKENLFFVLINNSYLETLKKNDFNFLNQLDLEVRERWKVSFDFAIGVFQHQAVGFTKNQKMKFFSNSFSKAYQEATTALLEAKNHYQKRVVVKTANKVVSFYNDRQQAPQIETDNLLFEKKREEFLEKLAPYSLVFISGHKKIDFDSFASGIALKLYLEHLFPKKEFLFFVSEIDEKAKTEINLALADKYDDYVSSLSQINQKLANTSSFAWILVDVNDLKIADLPLALPKGKEKKFFIIDHHVDSLTIPDPHFKFIYNDFSSNAELIINLFDWQHYHHFFPAFIFQFLAMGILVDTNNLQINLGSKTINTIDFLSKKGVNLEKTITNLKRFTAQFIAEKIEKIVVDSQKIILKIFDQDVNQKMASSLVNDFISKGVIDVVFVVLYNKKKEVFVSARSKTSFDVQKICYQLGGGGDKKRAAAQLSSVNVKTIIAQIKKMMLKQL